MYSKVIGIFCLIFSISLISKSELLQSRNCCPPAYKTDVIDYWSIQPDKNLKDFKDLEWVRILTHDFATIKSYASGVVHQIKKHQDKVAIVLKHSEGIFSIYQNIEHHHLEEGDMISKGEIIGVPAFNPELLNSSFDFAVRQGENNRLAELLK